MSEQSGTPRTAVNRVNLGEVIATRLLKNGARQIVEWYVPEHICAGLERELSEVTRERDELRELMVKGGLSLITPDEPPLEARQDWAKLRGAIAFQIIERHADDWDEIDTMMEEWRVARTQAVAARTLPTTELPKNET